MSTRPLAISMGDPTGVGPEVVARALAARSDLEAVGFGDPAVLTAAAAASGVGLAATVEAAGATGPHQPGRPTRASGAAAVAALAAAVDAVLAGRCAALVTAPIHKHTAHQAGFCYPGHTEYLAARAHDPPHAMMLAAARPGALRVTLCTTHLALREVFAALTPDRIAETIVLTARALRQDFGIAAPRIAVSGLNPHAGEGGAFGDEEAALIGPGIERARDALCAARIGATLDGPAVPDAVFRAAALGRYDAVVALYHDQGLIPFKLLHFDEGVNLTLGLPFPRTSPDHGTAHDLAGTGRASAGPMRAALELAAAMARTRAHW